MKIKTSMSMRRAVRSLNDLVQLIKEIKPDCDDLQDCCSYVTTNLSDLYDALSFEGEDEE